MHAHESLVGPSYTVTGRQLRTVLDPLAWWGQDSGQFPLMSKLANQILAQGRI